MCRLPPAARDGQYENEAPRATTRSRHMRSSLSSAASPTDRTATRSKEIDAVSGHQQEVNLSSRTWPILGDIDVTDGVKLGGHGQRHATALPTQDWAPDAGLPMLGGKRARRSQCLRESILFHRAVSSVSREFCTWRSRASPPSHEAGARSARLSASCSGKTSRWESWKLRWPPHNESSD